MLVLDLDETLIHCKIKNSGKNVSNIDTNFSEYTIWKRPHLISFLEEASKIYQIVVFTSSVSIYANKVVDLIDPRRSYIRKCISREYCTVTPNSKIYLKDLRIFKSVPISQIILVDNSILAYSYHLFNGIPIIPFFGQEGDQELIKLLKYLQTLERVNDVRVQNKNIFKFDVYKKYCQRIDILSRAIKLGRTSF